MSSLASKQHSDVESCSVSGQPNLADTEKCCSGNLSAPLLPGQSFRPSLSVSQQGVSDVELVACVYSQTTLLFFLQLWYVSSVPLSYLAVSKHS